MLRAFRAGKRSAKPLLPRVLRHAKLAARGWRPPLIILSVLIRVPPAEIGALRPALAIAVKASRGEPGNLAYTMAEDLIEPGVIRVFEAYVDEAALKAHGASDHFTAWREISGKYPREERRLYDATALP